MKIQELPIMIERQDNLITPLSKEPKRRLARFLNPSLASMESAFELPLSAFRLPGNTNVVVFEGGWTNPLKEWAEWVEKLRPIHESTWRQAGIHDAIMNSTYSIKPNRNLVLGLAERWCSVTNTFVFPFGEASVTLEDVAVLGGFSVLGECVFSGQMEEGCDVEVFKELERVRDMMNKTKSKKVHVSGWMKIFMGSGSCAEHVAFLVLWLSRHVFRFGCDAVGKQLHAMAVHLARGTRIALAPAVLASLYRDLDLLKQALVTKNKKVLKLWSPMNLVQVWAWERFPTLRPQPNPRIEEQPRMSKWNKVTTQKKSVETISEVANVRSAIESSGSKGFVWRPYAEDERERCWQLRNIYPDKEKWISVGPGMREDFKSFAKIVRVSELVGIDCIQPYYPHRVSIQFGLDQSIPGQVARCDESSEVAWKSYDRLIKDEKLFIPSRSFQSAVTSQYLEWWTQSKLVKKSKQNINVAKVEDRQKRKMMTELLTETHIPASPRTKKRKAVVEDITSPKKKLEADNSVSKSNEAAKAEYSRKRKRNDEQRVERREEGESPVDCMPYASADLAKRTKNKKQKAERTDVNKSPDNRRSSSTAELQLEVRNGNEIVIKLTDGDSIFDHGGSSLFAKSVMNGKENDDHGVERMDVIKIPNLETREDVAILRHGEAVNKAPDCDGSSPHVEPQNPSLFLLACNDNDVQPVSLMEPTKMQENTIPVFAENENEINCGLDASMESIEVPGNANKNNITRGDKAVAEVAVDGRVRIAENNGDNVNKTVSEFGNIRSMPLGARITRLEMMVAQLKRQRMDLKDIEI